MSISSDGFQLTPEQMTRLISLSRDAGKPLPEVLDDALAAYDPKVQSEPSRANGESFYEVASRLGLIGCIQGTPPDLSVDKKYMEGFGANDS